MSQKKIIILSIVAVIVLGLGLLVWGSYGFTSKSRFTHCMRDCYDLMILESSKQYCPGKCTEIHKFEPTAEELNQIIAEINNENVNTSSVKNTNTKANTNTNTAKNTNTVVNINAATNSALNLNISNTNTGERAYEDRSYYCNWVWYQEIIDKDTKELIYECPASRPWCNYADYTYENVGCCSDAAHTDCITLPNLL
ncbi:MAG: hypothetical protein ABIH38_03395 [Patescibacteria group bacterium]